MPPPFVQVNEKPNEPYTTPHRRGYEQLIRKLLRLPGPPAVVQMHHYGEPGVLD